MLRLFAVSAALLGASGVLLGAFGAHALRSELSQRSLETWQTAVSYQLLHALALLATALLLRQAQITGRSPDAALSVAGSAFLAGVLLFSGSLYALCLGAGSSFGPVTPLGGVSLIVGWLALALALWRQGGD